MKYLEYILASLCSLLLSLNLVSAGGHLEFKFISYVNEFGFDAARRHCDPTINGGKSSKCDLTFRLLLNGQNGGVGPTWPVIRTINYYDQDSVHFGSFIGSSLLNPFELQFTRWHGILNLNLKVIDVDAFTKNDHVDTLTSSILVSPDNVERRHRIMSHFHGHDSVFEFSLRVACDANYLSPTCLERCTKNHGQHVCGVANSGSRCTSGSCLQTNTATMVAVPVVLIFLLFALAVLTFRKRRKLKRLFLLKKNSDRIQEGNVKFENNMYVATEQDDIRETTENENDFANKLYGLSEDSSHKYPDQQNDGSVYDSLESNQESDVSDMEDNGENRTVMHDHFHKISSI